MTSTKPKVLITGVAGLIGSHFAGYLVSKGYDVIGVDNLSGGYEENIPDDVDFYQTDLGNQKALSSVFKTTKPDYVYHFAAYAAEGLSPFIRNFNYTNNVVCSANVVNECIKGSVKKIIFTSSMAVYGKGKPPFTETQKPEPEDPYGIAKYAVEMDLRQASKQFKLEYAVVRPHNVIGIRQNIWDRYRNVIGIWIRRILRGESICIFGDGEQRRAFSDVKFCMEPLEKLMTQCNGQIFNLGADKDYSLNEVSSMVQKVANQHNFFPTIEHLETRNEVKMAYSSHEKAKDILGFVDETNLEKTIDDMFVWAMKQDDKQIVDMPYEIKKGMYPSWK